MINVHVLTKEYGNVRAVDDLSFHVEPGKVTGFLGPNGAGKSTTMRMVMGLDHPTSGTALINGRQYTDLGAPLRHVGALLDAGAMHPGRTGHAHLTVQIDQPDLTAQHLRSRRPWSRSTPLGRRRYPAVHVVAAGIEQGRWEIWNAEDKEHAQAAAKVFATGVVMALKLIESAQTRWRAVNAPRLLAPIRARARFEKGKVVERHGASGRDEQVAWQAYPPVLTTRPRGARSTRRAADRQRRPRPLQDPATATLIAAVADGRSAEGHLRHGRTLRADTADACFSERTPSGMFEHEPEAYRDTCGIRSGPRPLPRSG